jgi:hypothetical protein
MNTHEPEDLNRLLSDAVDQIEPRSGIEAIRSRTAPTKESPMATSRAWMLGAFGAAAATAAVITMVMVLGTDDTPSTNSPDPLASGSPSSDVSESPTDEPVPLPGPAVPVYWVGETARGLGLYREFVPGPDGDDPLAFAVTTAVDGTPQDPDYRSGWPEAAGVAAASYDGSGITVDLTGDVHDRPAGMSEDEAQIAIEQLIYTAQGTVGKGRLPVQLLIDGSHTDQVLGQPASEPLANGPVLETLSLVNIDSPAEGAVVTGDELVVSGVANSFEANVVIRLQRYEGTYIAFQEGVTASGWMGEKLFPFSHTFDISDVEPGTYILMAMTDDASGGAEGFGADSDTKVITIK